MATEQIFGCVSLTGEEFAESLERKLHFYCNVEGICTDICNEIFKQCNEAFKALDEPQRCQKLSEKQMEKNEQLKASIKETEDLTAKLLEKIEAYKDNAASLGEEQYKEAMDRLGNAVLKAIEETPLPSRFSEQQAETVQKAIKKAVERD